jgi:hypothetical protein
LLQHRQAAVTQGWSQLAAKNRKATEARGLAILSAIKVGYSRQYDDGQNPDYDLPTALFQTQLEAGQGMLFECLHTSGGPLTGMLPTSADFMINAMAIPAPCDGWRIEGRWSVTSPAGNTLHHLPIAKYNINS